MTAGRLRRFVLTALAIAIAACARTMPDHDNRIFTAVPVAKLSAADLVRTFTDDPSGAADRFVGRAIEVSGTVRDLADPASMPQAFLLHAGETGPQVHISLHEDRATEMLKGLANGQRATFRCFCEGARDGIQLKSCVVP
jgi:hypothetical protein